MPLFRRLAEGVRAFAFEHPGSPKPPEPEMFFADPYRPFAPLSLGTRIVD
jgi:hypothetical protein